VRGRKLHLGISAFGLLAVLVLGCSEGPDNPASYAWSVTPEDVTGYAVFRNAQGDAFYETTRWLSINEELDAFIEAYNKATPTDQAQIQVDPPAVVVFLKLKDGTQVRVWFFYPRDRDTAQIGVFPPNPSGVFPPENGPKVSDQLIMGPGLRGAAERLLARSGL
jgi:hypothetical protein